jgi:uncharacterized protein (UPF0548 family)
LGTGLIHSADAPRALAELARRQIIYDPATAPCDGRIAGHWHLDSGEIDLGTEAPGPPLTDGVFARACFLVRWYEFTDPAIVRAVYRADSDLLGRDMLLEARFFGLRFHLGVRVTAVLDEVRGSGSGAQRVWGWSYQTLQGHLEQGRLGYEVIKDLASGSVRFRVVGYSRAAPIRNPLIRLGFALFGRRTQTRFYRTIQQRMRTLVNGPADGRPLPGPGSRPDGVVVAPSGAGTRPQDRVGWWVHHPGR